MVILDNIKPNDTAKQLLESYKYWHNKRLFFNILVGLTGLISTLYFSKFDLKLFDIFGCVLWGIVANIFYSVGYVIESWLITYTQGNRNLTNFRNSLFWLGTILYMLVSIIFASFYFLFS